MTQFEYLQSAGAEQCALQTLRNDVKVYLATEVLLHFTDHGIGHSDRMVEIIADLIKPIQGSGTGLNAAELTTLYAACYLHDLGMHVEKLTGLRSVSSDWADLQKTTREQIMRDKHHVISAELVMMAAQNSGPCQALHLKDLHPEQVACLCEAHNLWLEKSDDSTRYGVLTRDVAVGMRMDFLAALLRLADVLDESQSRAGIDKARTLDLDKVALKHWWRHYYTEHITFTQNDRKLILEFRFPEDKADEYAGIIPELQYPYIAAEMQRQATVLTKNNCVWLIDKKIVTTPYSTKEAMPQDVELAMLADLERRRTEREERERIAALTGLRESRPAIQRAIKQLSLQKNELSATDFIKEALALHWRLWLAGAKRSAFGSFECVFRDSKDALPSDVRLECACQLSSWRRECGLAYICVQELQGMQPEADKLPEKSPLRFIFYRELFQCLYDIGINYPAASCAAKMALSSASLDSEKLETIADLAEMSFVLAEPRDARATLKEHEGLYKADKTLAGLRCRLLRWRLTAMKGNATEVIAEIDAYTKYQQDWKGNSDVLRCLLLKAEILRLTGDLPSAIAVFRDQLWENLTALPPSESFAFAACYQDVALNAFEKEPLIKWTDLVDERITAGVEFEDKRHALGGYDSVAEGKHYDALPEFIKSYRNVYRQGSWPARHNACGRLAIESAAIGNVHDAVFYCILGSSKERNKTVAKALVDCANVDELVRSITTSLEFAHLPVHAQCACEMLESIGDEIPDAVIPGVVRYLVECTDIRTKGGFSSTTVSEAAWTALESIGDRIDSTVAREIVSKVLTSDLAAQNVLLRRKQTPLLTKVVSKLDEAQIALLSEAAVSILTEQHHDLDFNEAVNLLVEIAAHASNEVKARIRDRMYPDGKCKGNGLLLQIANLFDVTPFSDELNAVARWLLERITSEVLVLNLDAEVPQSGSMSFARIVNDKRVVTYDMPSVVMWGLTRHIKQIDAQSWSLLLKALLSNLINPEDSVVNKCEILGVLPCFLCACDSSERANAVRIIANIASSEPVAPSGSQTEEEANHPLQRFRMFGGSPQQVRGSAIRCLTQIAKDHPENYPSGELQKILEAGVASTSDDVRRATFVAAQTHVLLSDRTLMQMLIGTRDETPVAAASALYVFANNTAIAVAPITEMLCYTLRYAVRSKAKALRMASAKLLVRLEQESLERCVAQEVTNLADALRQDGSWSVRRIVGVRKTAQQDESKVMEIAETDVSCSSGYPTPSE